MNRLQTAKLPEKTAKAWWEICLFYGGILLLAFGDWLSKQAAAAALQERISPLTLIPHVLQLTYVENRGMAFGMLQGARGFLIGVCVLILGISSAVFFRTRISRRTAPFLAALVMVCGGGLGNCIDRIMRGYVVDFIYFSLIDFPVFNVADCFVVVGSALLVLFVLLLPEETAP